MEPVNKLPRRKRSVSEIKALIEAQAESNEKVKDFCQSHQVSRALFYHWRNKYGNSEIQTGFVHAQLESQEEPAVAVFAEIDFPQQISIRLFHRVDPRYLKA